MIHVTIPGAGVLSLMMMMSNVSNGHKENHGTVPRAGTLGLVMMSNGNKDNQVTVLGVVMISKAHGNMGGAGVSDADVQPM